MNLNRRQLMWLASASALGSHRLAFANPSLRLLVGFAAGGAADAAARALGEGLRDAGYTAIVDNKAGASGRLAIETLWGAPPAGDTVLIAPLGNLSLHPHIFRALRYDTLKDFVPLAGIASMSFGLAVNANSPARTLEEFLALAAKDSRQAAYAVPGMGSNMNFIGSLLAKASKVPLMAIPYKCGGAAMNDVLSGIAPSTIAATPALLPLVRSGRLRVLAVTDSAPNPALPGVPTFASLGFKDIDQLETFGVFARTGTPEPVLKSLQQALLQAAASPRTVEMLKKLDFRPEALDRAALTAALRAEHIKWGAIVKDAGYTPES